MDPIDHVPDLVRRLYVIVGELEGYFPGRPFTLDGHLVGSLGEVLAAHLYGLTLLPCSAEDHDAVCQNGRRVQIKATQGKQVGLRSECQHLVVLQLHRDGTAVEAYNGPGLWAWDAAGPMQRNGQRTVSLTKLRQLMAAVPVLERLPRRSGPAANNR
jgi:hypothetical protein